MSMFHEGARERLPERPSVEHLKKQAKRLVKEEPSLSLQQAQHQVAKSYGYRNWEALLSEVRAAREAPLTVEVVKRFVGAMEGDVAGVRRMLDEEPRLVHWVLEGYSMLSYAAERDRVAVIELLIERGADPNVYWSSTLHSPLSWAVRRGGGFSI